MATQRINFAEIKETFVGELSEFNVLIAAMDDKRVAYNAKKDALITKRDKILKQREEAREADPDITAKFLDDNYDIATVNTEIVAAEIKYKAEKKVDESLLTKFYDKYGLKDLHKAYVESLGSNPLTFSDEIVKFLNTIGAKKTDDNKAVSKFAVQMSTYIGAKAVGKKNDKANLVYIKAMSYKQFAKLFMFGFLDLAVNKHKALVVNDDYTVAVRVYEAEESTENTEA